MTRLDIEIDHQLIRGMCSSILKENHNGIIFLVFRHSLRSTLFKK